MGIEHSQLFEDVGHLHLLLVLVNANVEKLLAAGGLPFAEEVEQARSQFAELDLG